VQGLISLHDIITFLVNNYKGEVDFFRKLFSNYENESNISHCSKNFNLVRAQHTETLFEVLIKLREKRISMIAVERTFYCKKTQREISETVGIVFLTDLMYILRQINFADILKQPVMNFVMNLNGTDEDRKAFKLKLSKEGGNHGIDSD
jgi:hypothetical protein